MNDFKMMPEIFYIVSLNFDDSGSDNFCTNLAEVNQVLSNYIEKLKNINQSSSITIKKYKANEEITRDLTVNEFIRMFFDNIEWVIDNITELETITF